MTEYTPSLDRLINSLQNFPGVGERTAERLAFYILNTRSEEIDTLREELKNARDETLSCSICFNVTEQDPCEICSDPERDASTICVCESPRDLRALENSGEYDGVYHVLLGTIDPLEGVSADDLTLDELRRRLDEGEVQEVIIATNPTAEGDQTALHIAEFLSDDDVEVTRIARGIPSGSSLEYASPSSVAEAVEGRQRFQSS